MKRLFTIATMSITICAATSCGEGTKGTAPWIVDRFDDIKVIRYEVPGFETLPLEQKELVYYLAEAAKCGRDILFDQNCVANLPVRRTLEVVYENYAGDRTTAEWKALEKYLKKVWFANGIHHHYSNDKFTPEFTEGYLLDVIETIPEEKFGELNALREMVCVAIFDPAKYPTRLNQRAGDDLLLTSSSNYYRGVSQAEAESFYAGMAAADAKDPEPVSYGLNSQLTKDEAGKLAERTWRVGGMYSAAIERIVYWLEKAAAVAENPQQKAVIDKLIEFNKTGDLKQFDEYCILWVGDHASQIDFVTGFTETYGDPLGLKASWEAVINFKNIEATKRTEIISSNAQWFEDHSPIDAQYKKEEVKGVSAKVITAAMLGGDCYPSTPIGINLPNSNWIRHDYGSKSVTIENITEAYDKSALGNGFAEEFMWSDVERERARKFGSLTNNLHTDLHECLGHGSGKLLPGVDPDALKEHGSTIEETRADLFGLYYMGDPIMMDLELLPDAEAYKAEYYQFMMNGLMTQLTRIEPGKNIEESHMRNRQLIASWVMEKGAADKVVEFVQRDGKTYVVINDYEKLRELFGALLKEIQHIKSTGNYEAAKRLVENYAVNVDPVLHKEVLARYEKLNLAPYKGFINPVYTPVYDENGKITDVKVSYTEGYAEQHLRYSKEFATLPTYN